jgi:hypothetical protein
VRKQLCTDLSVEPKVDNMDQVAMSSPTDKQKPTLEIDKQTGEEERVNVSTTTLLSDNEEMQQTADLSVEPKVDNIDQVALSSPTDKQKSTLEIEKQTGEEERVDVSTTNSLSDDEEMQQTVDLSVEPKVDNMDQVAMSSPTDKQKPTLEIEKQTGEEETVDVSTTLSLSDDEKDSPLKVSSTSNQQQRSR